jgi:NodT family efflux transporter outer membrane factor (OMF) lipoprotein
MPITAPLFKIAALTALGCGLLAGCVVGPNYKGPPAVVPAAVSAPAFKRADDATQAPPPSRWWTALNDPELDHLIDAAFAASPDIEIATARLRQSRATLSRDRAGLLPSTGASALYLNSKGLTSALAGGASGGGDGALDLYQAGVDATWQLDLFGGKRRAVEGDKAAAQAVQANLEDTQVSLAAEVAQDYVTLRDLQQRLALARRNVEVESQMLAMTRLRRQGGDASDLDVERMLNQLQSTQADAAPITGQIADQLDRLAILTGRAPGDLDQELAQAAPTPTPPPVVAVGDPATLLRNRPDVRAAERVIQQKNALVGQRTADLFPKVELLGEVGYTSGGISSLFNSSSFSYVGAPVLQWSPFDFGRTRAGINEAEGERAEALAQYRRTVLGALADAETALALYGRQRDTLRSLLAVQVSADRAAAMTALRVKGGTATTLDQLSVETDRLAAQSNVSQATARLTLAFITLEKSLGLGWDSADDKGRD